MNRGKLFGLLMNYWSINIDPETTLGLRQEYTLDNIQWWYWCDLIVWKNKVTENVATNIYNGQLTTMRQVLYALERQWRMEFHGCGNKQIQEGEQQINTAKHLQQVVWEIYQMDRNEEETAREEHHRNQEQQPTEGTRDGHAHAHTDAHCHKRLLPRQTIDTKKTTRPQTRSQDPKKDQKGLVKRCLWECNFVKL